MLLHGMTPFIQDDRLFVHLTGEKVPEDILELAKANGKIILDTMRVWNEGTTFITCEYGSKHMLDLFCDWSIDEKRRITRVTDLHNMLDRSIDTPCSDDIMMAVGECPCGRTNLIESINDRFSTTITTDRGILGYADLDGLFFSVMRKESVGRDGRSLTVVYARHEGRLYFMCNRSSNIPPSTRTAVTAGLQDIIGSLHGLDARTIFWESDATPKRLDGMPKFFPIMIVESDQELQLVIDSIC